TGTRLPLATLFQCPTIAHLAQSLRHEGVVAPESLPRGMQSESTPASSLTQAVAKYIPSKYYAYVRHHYHSIKQSTAYLYVRGKYIKYGKKITRRFFSYTPVQLERKLIAMGLADGDTVLMHSAFNMLNGFDGTPDQVIDCILNIIGNSGN